MAARLRDPGGPGGFTLIELVIAMACVGLVVGGIALSVNTAINVWNRSAEAADLNQEARAVLELISRDLRGVYFGLDGQTGYLMELAPEATGPGSGVEALELATYGAAVERVGFLSREVWKDWDLLSLPPISDYLAVRYQWLDETSHRVAGLYRLTAPAPMAREEDEAEEPPIFVTEELVSPAVTRLQFDYYDGEEEEWVDSWDSSDPSLRRHPLLAVRVLLSLKDARGREHDFETIVPISVH